VSLAIPWLAVTHSKVLQLRPNCERCDRALPADSPGAMICTFECTFCRDCVDGDLAGVCPNCGGNFERRPIRPANLLDKYPPKTKQSKAAAGHAGD